MTAAASFDPDLTVVRRTFLRRHVAAQLAQTADVLAVDGICRRVEPLLPDGDGEARLRVASVLRLDHFFERHHRFPAPDVQVYFPLKVRPTPGVVGPSAANLTALLRQLDATGDRRGIVLNTRTGAGKTVAARKAFFDCVFASAGSAKPPLADFLPCWLDLAESLDEGTVLQQRRHEYQQTQNLAALQDRTTDDTVVLELLRSASEWPGVRLEQVRDWLRFGPKVLLFADLNAADAATRAVASRALATFQHQHGAAGHRVVVAYRTTQPEDATIRGPDFRDYNLDTIPRDQALAYLRNVRDFERAVYERLRKALPTYAARLTAPDRDIDAEAAKLAELIDRYDRTADGAEESVICTPLLMHLMSQLEPGTAGQVRSLTDLFDRVVEQHLRFDEDQYGTTRTPALPANLRGEDGRARRKTGMTRVALMMHAGNTNSLRKQTVEKAWYDPQTGMQAHIGGSERPWQPVDDVGFAWTASPYCTTHFPPDFKEPFSIAMDLPRVRSEHDALMQYGMLRRDSESVRFLHDSFIDYFVGSFAMARPHHPNDRPHEQGLEPLWFPAVATWMHMTPERFRNAALFLAGALNPVQLRELLLHMIPAEPKDGWPAVVGSILRGRPLEADAVLDTLARTLRVPTIYVRPETLFHQCHDDLEWPCRDEDIPVCQSVAEELRRRMRRPWLRYRKRGRRRPEMILRGHRGEVYCLAVLPDGRIASGAADGTVRVWDLAGGEPLVLEGHNSWVKAVVALGDGRIASGSWDHTVRVWDLAGGEPLVLEGHREWVESVAELEDGRLVSGDYRGTLRVWDLAGGEPAVLKGHRDNVYSLAALEGGRFASAGADWTVRVWDLAGGEPLVLRGHRGLVLAVAALEGGRIASGGAFGDVRVWDLVGGEPLVLQGHRDRVYSVAELDDGRLVSGGEDGTVRVWDLAGGEPLVLEGHRGPVYSVAELKDGRLVSGGNDGTVRVWDLAAHSEPLSLFGGRGWVDSLAALKGGQVASLGDDRKVRVWEPAGGEPLVLEGHRGLVRSLAALKDGRLVTGGEDKTVRVWDLAGGEPLVLEGHRGIVVAVAALEGCRVVSWGADDTVRVWDLAGGEPLVLTGGHGSVEVVAALQGGRVAWAGDDDGTVRVWDPASGESLILRGHAPRVRSLAALKDGRLVSGDSSGRLRVWDLAGGEPLVLEGHSGGVWSVATLEGGHFVSGGKGIVRVWDLAGGEPLVFYGHQDSVTDLAALEGDRFVSGSRDGTVRVWDLNRENAIMILEAEDLITKVCVLSHPRRIALVLATGRVLFADFVE